MKLLEEAGVEGVERTTEAHLTLVGQRGGVDVVYCFGNDVGVVRALLLFQGGERADEVLVSYSCSSSRRESSSATGCTLAEGSISMGSLLQNFSALTTFTLPLSVAGAFLNVINHSSSDALPACTNVAHR